MHHALRIAIPFARTPAAQLLSVIGGALPDKRRIALAHSGPVCPMGRMRMMQGHAMDRLADRSDPPPLKGRSLLHRGRLKHRRSRYLPRVCPCQHNSARRPAVPRWTACQPASSSADAGVARLHKIQAGERYTRDPFQRCEGRGHHSRLHPGHGRCDTQLVVLHRFRIARSALRYRRTGHPQVTSCMMQATRPPEGASMPTNCEWRIGAT